MGCERFFEGMGICWSFRGKVGFYDVEMERWLEGKGHFRPKAPRNQEPGGSKCWVT